MGPSPLTASALVSRPRDAYLGAMSGRERAYESYEGFLRESIKTYWETQRGKRVNFLALLFACQSAWGAAWDEIRDPAMAKRVLTGVGGAAAVALILRIVLGGPIGLLITGASLASLVALYVRRNRQIIAKVSGYREIIAEYRPRYEGVQSDYDEDKIDDKQRRLMIDGLMIRFLDALDDYEPPKDEAEDDRSSFQRHVDAKRDAEDEL